MTPEKVATIIMAVLLVWTILYVLWLWRTAEEVCTEPREVDV